MLNIRAVHLDLKGSPPTADFLVSLPKLFAAAGYNAVLVEWEDMFPWTVDRRFRHPAACYTREVIQQFVESMESEKLELIPLIQCLGHLEFVLSVPGYESLRELSDQSDVLNPLAEGAGELIGSMIEEVLHVLPQVRWMHLGGDEAWTFGNHPDTRAFISKHGKGTLYLNHVEPFMEMLKQRGVRSLLWHDMMIDWESADLRRLASQADVVAWGYRGHPDSIQGHYRTDGLVRLHDHGIRLWGAAAFKGADGAEAERPNLSLRRENANAWCELSHRFGFEGLIATGWSRYASHRGQCETLSASLDSLFMLGRIFNGEPETDPTTLLQQTPYFELFENSRVAAERVGNARSLAWDIVCQVRQHVYQERRRPSRRCSVTGQQLMEMLHAALDALREACDQLRDVLAQVVVDDVLNEYVKERYEFLVAEAAEAESLLLHHDDCTLMKATHDMRDMARA